MENTQAYNNLLHPITQAFAAQTSYQARVNGTYPGYIKFNSGAEVYIANIPSLIWSNSGETINLLSTGTYFVVNRQVNLPYKITPDTITENQTADILLQSITGQSNATLTGVSVTTVDTPEEITQTFTGQVLASFAWVSGMEPNSSVSSHVVIMERVITGNSTTGGTYIPVYLNCSETTQSWYTIPPLAHATQTTQTKSIANGTGSLTADCTDGILSYNPETVSCTTPGFVEWPNLTCIADVCGSTITDANAHANQTSQTTTQTWHYDANPGICTYACNPNYTHNTGSQLCEPNNCTAGAQTHNAHTYNVPELNHSITGSVISTPVAITNGTQTFTMVYECSFWTATGITTEVANTPNCNPNFHYDTGTSSCVSDTQTFTCTAKPATGTAWSSVSSYSQTWNGASYIPADSTTAYNTTPDTASCRYKCDTGYVWNAGTSLCEVKLYVDDVFSAYTYTGNGGTQTINNGINLSGQWGMVWIRARNYSMGNFLFDTSRGANQALSTDLTDAQRDYSPTLTAFNSNGFNLGSFVSLVNGAFNYASWTFRKAPKFFDVVTYTGDGNASRQIAHSLGIAPGMIIVKRTNSPGDWFVWHRSYSPQVTQWTLYLNTTATVTNTSDRAWGEVGNSIVNTTSTFSVGQLINVSGATYVAYLYAHDTSADGIIQCGSFNAAWQVTLGWEPQYLLYKRTDSASNWITYDSSRGFDMTTQKPLYANLSNAEGTGDAVITPNATGFYSGYGGQTFIYCAIRRPNKSPTSGTQVYSAIARTGNGTLNTKVTGLGFAPDLIFAAARTYIPRKTSVYDRLRGNVPILKTTTIDTEVNGGVSLVASFDMDGMTVGDDGANWVNDSGTTYINHFFRRAPWFFDMVAYTGTGVARTVNHNLGVVPELMIAKRRDNTGNWQVYHSSLGSGNRLLLEQTFATITGDTGGWGSTAPTSSVFTAGIYSATSAPYIAYLFATLPNISKVGSYTGNGGTLSINAGFDSTARFILIKRTDVAGDWFVWDSARGIVTGTDPHLSLNTTAAEVTNDDSVDPASTGFAVNQVAATNINVSGGTYIYLAVH